MRERVRGRQAHLAASVAHSTAQHSRACVWGGGLLQWGAGGCTCQEGGGPCLGGCRK